MYAELQCKTNFSFLRGASDASEYVKRAAELGIPAIAVTEGRQQNLDGFFLRRQRKTA